MRNVVIPLEITEISSEILPVIRRVFHPGETALTLLTVFQPVTIPPLMASAPMMDGMAALSLFDQYVAEWQAHQQEAKKRLLEIAQTLGTEGYKVHTAFLEGEIVQAVADFVNAHAFDVLAMATFGRTGLDRLLNGSIAESLLRRVSTPMLLIRHQPEDGLTEENMLPIPMANEPVLA